MVHRGALKSLIVLLSFFDESCLYLALRTLKPVRQFETRTYDIFEILGHTINFQGPTLELHFRFPFLPLIFDRFFEKHTVCNIFALIFPIWITCYPQMRTINFSKYLRLFQNLESRLNQSKRWNSDLSKLEKQDKKCYILQYLRCKKACCEK